MSFFVFLIDYYGYSTRTCDLVLSPDILNTPATQGLQWTFNKIEVLHFI